MNHVKIRILLNWSKDPKVPPILKKMSGFYILRESEVKKPKVKLDLF